MVSLSIKKTGGQKFYVHTFHILRTTIGTTTVDDRYLNTRVARNTGTRNRLLPQKLTVSDVMEFPSETLPIFKRFMRATGPAQRILPDLSLKNVWLRLQIM
jgi:hypothetical protein